jgi:tetratricopeptide (TPR) repeat protein
MSGATPQAARLRAEAALELRRFEDAEREAREAIACAPEDPEGHGLHARALLGLKRFREAQKAAEAGLALSPGSEWHHRLRASALLKQGLHGDALGASDAAARLAPDLGLAHYSRALALSELKRVREAREANLLAIELDPQNPDLRRHLGDLFLADDPKAAEAHYRSCLAIDPRDAHALNNLGVALTRQRRSYEAAATFRSALLLDPTLKVAKENTLTTVNGLLHTSGPIVALFALLQIVRIVGAASEAALPLVAVLAVLTLLGLWSFLRWRVRRRRARLAEIDPQITRVFEQLQADRRSGRL